MNRNFLIVVWMVNTTSHRSILIMIQRARFPQFYPLHQLNVVLYLPTARRFLAASPQKVLYLSLKLGLSRINTLDVQSTKVKKVYLSCERLAVTL